MQMEGSQCCWLHLVREPQASGKWPRRGDTKFTIITTLEEFGLFIREVLDKSFDSPFILARTKAHIKRGIRRLIL